MTISPKNANNKKKILIVDDSALMRRVVCDIINSDDRFQVADQAIDGEQAYALLKSNQYDAVILDVNMPKMDGIQLLRLLKKDKIRAKIMMASTDTREGASVTLEALELGAIDFIEKPANILHLKGDEFRKRFLGILSAVTYSRQTNISKEESPISKAKLEESNRKILDVAKRGSNVVPGQKVVAIACSTGGPKALQSVIPKLPAELDAPVLIVQHMPQGFTQSLAERLNSMSKVSVKEAVEGEPLESGKVYIARGGLHLNVAMKGKIPTVHYSEEPPREGVKPCANYMYESLKKSNYAQVICVVLTGMGADGTKGIVNLETAKKIHVIAQDEGSSTVYGMPKSIAATGLVNQVVTLDDVAQEIVMNVGVK